MLYLIGKYLVKIISIHSMQGKCSKEEKLKVKLKFQYIPRRGNVTHYERQFDYETFQYIPQYGKFSIVGLVYLPIMYISIHSHIGEMFSAASETFI